MPRRAATGAVRVADSKERGAVGLRGTLDALIESAAFERLLLERARPVLASAETAEDAVIAAVAVALDSPVMAVAAGPREAECLAAGLDAYLGPDRVGL